MKRRFFPGEEWLFFKIYVGIREADNILVTKLWPYVRKLLRQNTIDSWFFIRYSDPDYHLRLRLHLKDVSKIGNVIIGINHALKSSLSNHVVTSIVIDTYVRELERYGNEHIIDCEQFFYIDSQLICTCLSALKDAAEDDKWKVALLLADRLLSDLFPDIASRIEFVENLATSYSIEFGYKSAKATEINALYRTYRMTIENIICNTPVHLKLIDKSCDKLHSLSKNYARHDSTLSSLLHMRMNRLFTVNQRRYELIIYSFLLRFYKGLHAKKQTSNML